MTWPVQITTLGPIAGGTVVFVERGVTYVTVVAKAAFAMIHEGLAVQVPASPLLIDDETELGTADIAGASEIAPFIPGVDVIVRGHARALHGAPTPAIAARLVVVGTPLAGDPIVVLDKTVHAYGPRATDDAYPEPFVSASLGGEHLDGTPRASRPEAPKLVLPAGVTGFAGFGPIPSESRDRIHLLEQASLAVDGSLLNLSDDFPFEYFHVAPVDQRLASVPDGAWLMLDGMHPDLPRFATKLPYLRAEAQLFDPSGKPTPVALACDTLHIDMDARVATLLFRGHIPAPAPEIHQLSAVASLETMRAPPNTDTTSGALSDTPSTEPPANRKTIPPEPAIAPESAMPFRVSAVPREPKPQQPPSTVGLPFGPRPADSEAAVAGPSAGRQTRPPPRFDEDSTPDNTVSPDAALPFQRPDDSPEPRGTDAAAMQVTANGASTSVATPSASAASSATIAGPTTDADEPPRSGFAGLLGASLAKGPSAATAEPPRVPPLAPATRPVRLPSAPVIRAATVGGPHAAPSAIKDEEGMATRDEASTADLPDESTVAVQASSATPRGATPSGAVSTTDEVGVRGVAARRLAKGEAFYDADFAGADLSGMDFSKAALTGINLTGAKLHDCKFDGARLTGAKLAAADLSRASFVGADLGNANLSKAQLREASFEAASLSEANLSLADGTGAIFDKATGNRANFTQGKWMGASFRGAELPSGDFSGAELSSARFDGAKLDAARFADARGTAANFSAASAERSSFVGANVEGFVFDDAVLTSSTWERATLRSCSFVQATLTKVVFARTALHQVSFAQSDMTGANLVGASGPGISFADAKLVGADLRQTKLTDPVFDRADLQRVNAHKASLLGARFVGANLETSSLRGARLKGASLEGARIADADLRDADLENANLRDVRGRETAKLGGANLRGTVTESEATTAAEGQTPSGADATDE